MTRVGLWWRRRAWRWQTGVALGSVLMGGAAIAASFTNLLDETNEHANDETLREQLERATFEQECRFDLSAPVQDAEAAVQDAVNEKIDGLAAGLVALEEEDPVEVAEQVERIRQARIVEQTNRVVLREALEERAAAVATCNDRADEFFGARPAEDP